jgi:hypothetical protein
MSMPVFLSVVAIALLSACTLRAGHAELPLFDAHIHYNHDAWEKTSPKEAITLLRQAGVVRALVSSSSDEGTQRLYAEAPDLIVPELRPYRRTEKPRVGSVTIPSLHTLKSD